jgi:hypothetical protein
MDTPPSPRLFMGLGSGVTLYQKVGVRSHSPKTGLDLRRAHKAQALGPQRLGAHSAKPEVHYHSC